MHDKERHNGEPAIRRATSLAAWVILASSQCECP
jgi:hypothetical protein